MMKSAAALFLYLCTTALAFTDKGPRGLQLLNDRYALVADENTDTLLVVNYVMGGVEGVIRLHPAELDPTSLDEGRANSHPVANVGQWSGPTDVATCLNCDYVYVVQHQDPRIVRANLAAKWKTMVDSGDFSPLNEFDGTLTPVIGFEDEEHDKVGKTRRIVMKANGEAYFVHTNQGIWKINHKGHASEFMNADDLGIGKLWGLHLSADENYLVASSKHEVAKVHVEGKTVKTEHVFHEGQCNPYHHEMWNMVMAVDDRHAYGFAANPDQSTAGGALYKFPLITNSTGSHSQCKRIAGDQSEHRSWVDGAGEVARFATHQGAGGVAIVSSGTGVDRLLVADTDNRALRLIVVQGYEAEVFTVEYNHDLWFKLYHDKPWVPKTRVHLAPTENGHQKTMEAHHQVCENKGMKLCAVDEVRANTETIMANEQLKKEQASLQMWTSTPCTSCFLSSPGYCPDQETTGLLRNTHQTSELGAVNFMTATIHKHVHNGKTHYTVENQCLQHKHHLDTNHAICCSAESEIGFLERHWVLGVVLIGVLFLFLLFVIYLFRSHIAAVFLSCCFACSRLWNKKTEASYDHHKRVTKKLVENALARTQSCYPDNVNLMEKSRTEQEHLHLDPDGETVWQSKNDKERFKNATVV